MTLFQSKAFKAWAPVLAIVAAVIVAVLFLGNSDKAVAPSPAATTTQATSTATPAAPSASSTPSGIGIGGVKSTTYVPTGWTLKFKLQAGWTAKPIRNEDGTVSQVTIGTSATSMSVVHDKPFGKPAQKTPVMSTVAILGEEVEVATYDEKSFFTVRHDGDDYHFSVQGPIAPFVASIQVQ